MLNGVNACLFTAAFADQANVLIRELGLAWGDLPKAYRDPSARKTVRYLQVIKWIIIMKRMIIY